MNIINFIIQIQACKPHPAMARADDDIISAAAMKIMSSHTLGWGHELQTTSSLSAFISGQMLKCRLQIGRITQAKSITYLLLETVHAPHIHMKGGAQTLAVMAHYGKQPCPLSLTSTCPLLLE